MCFFNFSFLAINIITKDKIIVNINICIDFIEKNFSGKVEMRNDSIGNNQLPWGKNILWNMSKNFLKLIKDKIVTIIGKNNELIPP